MSVTTDPWRALSDGTRRELLARVARRPSSVAELARHLPMSRPAVSQHHKVLLDAGLVEAQKEGRQRFYAARPDGLAALRAELDAFWGEALRNFKQITETIPEETS